MAADNGSRPPWRPTLAATAMNNRQVRSKRKQEMTKRTVMVMAAGTGGHIVPGIAVARELQQRGWQVLWVGTERGMENKLVPPTGIPLIRLAFHGVRGKGLLGSLKGVLQLGAAFVRSLKLMFEHRPDVILGMGGYVCFPGGLMASLLGKPLLLGLLVMACGLGLLTYFLVSWGWWLRTRLRRHRRVKASLRGARTR